MRRYGLPDEELWDGVRLRLCSLVAVESASESEMNSSEMVRSSAAASEKVQKGVNS